MEDADHDMPMGREEHGLNNSSNSNGALEPEEYSNGDKLLFLQDDGEPSPSSDDEFEEPEPENGVLNYPLHIKRRGLLATGCCYDDRMKLHANADFGPYPHHPEDPSRIAAIMQTFKQAGLIYTGSDADLADIIRTHPTKYMWRIAAREARQEEIVLVHDPDHYFWVEGLSRMSTKELRKLTKIMDQGRDSLYIGSMTFEAALISAGGAIETCKAVTRGDVKNAIAVIRPPGHHAECNQSMGFCVFNNVPIAARVCQREYPELCRKVLVLDWDVHHGNGVQNMFYDDPNVLYISIHVFNNGVFYPGKPEDPKTPDGDIDKCGHLAGLGKNINIGWHDQGMGDGEYMAAFQKIIMPIANEFNPDLVIISAGFDAAAGDELGGCFVTPACYAHMTHMLMSLADGKVAACLEGGYNLGAISQSALAVARTLMGEPPPKIEIPNINKEASKILAKVQAYQAPYWECMRPGIINIQDLRAQGGMRLHDVVRNYQRQTLAQKHSMLPLFIQREALSKSFENQVLVTPRLHTARKLIMFIHDPPELLAQPNPLDNSVEMHNAWMVDGMMQYIDWAVSKNFGIIDINVPHHITQPKDSDAYTPKPDERLLQSQIQELVCFLWDNYLQVADAAEDIFLVGVGNSYLGVKVLLMNRDCKLRISGVLNFVSGALRPVRSDVDPELSMWYKENSRIYVANDHLCWDDPDLHRKINRRRFGAVWRSSAIGLNSMMKEHAEEAQTWILDRLTDAHGDTTEDDKMT